MTATSVAFSTTRILTSGITKVSVPTSTKKDEWYYIQGGIEQAFFPVGKSTFFGEYFDGKFGAAICNGTAANGCAAASGTTVATSDAGLGLGKINSSEITYWGVGFNQNVAAAAMDIYVSYRNYGFDVKDITGKAAAVNDMQTVVMGAKIQF